MNTSSCFPHPPQDNRVESRADFTRVHQKLANCTTTAWRSKSCFVLLGTKEKKVLYTVIRSITCSNLEARGKRISEIFDVWESREYCLTMCVAVIWAFFLWLVVLAYLFYMWLGLNRTHLAVNYAWTNWPQILNYTKWISFEFKK